MSAKRFLADALSSALGVGLATPDDVMAHITPEQLAAHLPRPLWARLLIASLGAPRLDSAVVLDTVGVATICEHMPSDLVFACLTGIAHRALGKHLVAPAPAPSLGHAGSRVAIPPAPSHEHSEPAVAATAASATPGQDDISNLAASLSDAIDDALLPSAAPVTTDSRGRSAPRVTARPIISTRPGASTRKPQSAAPAAIVSTGRVPQPFPPAVRRSETELENFADFASAAATGVLDEPLKTTIESEDNVDEEQLVDWRPT
ncbi:MAG: hypothetical protein KBG15_04960, partial [Kofleriaceae bacterium]|nr:hypothetical protein [Kofleriaceae bacterium]